MNRNAKPFSFVVPVVLTCFVLVGAAIALLVDIWSCSNPRIVVPLGNRKRFAWVAILMDGTGSVGKQRFARGQQVVLRQILPSVGIDDAVVGYDVQPGEAGQANEVFGFSPDQQPPRLSASAQARMLVVLRRNGPGAARAGAAAGGLYWLVDELGHLRSQLAIVRDQWSAQVRSRPAPPPGGSNICGILVEIAGWLAKAPPDVERWLFILSDLKQEGNPEACRSSAPGPNGLPFPADVQVRLIYSPQPGLVQPYWPAFFGPRRPEWLPFAMLAGPPLLAPNPLAGLDAVSLSTTGACFRGFRDGLAPPIGGGLLGVIWLASLAAWAARRAP